MNKKIRTGLNIRMYKSSDAAFIRYMRDKAITGVDSTTDVEPAVRVIVDDVRARGLKAVLEYTERFDRVKLTAKTIEITDAQRKAAWNAAPKKERAALQAAAKRIRAYQKELLLKSWTQSKNGETLGQLIIPMERAGIYVPGGKAAYPSSVLMNAIPARLAGVDEVIMVTPPQKGGLNPLVIAAAQIAGVDRIFQVGGAQAIAALAYGAGLPKVDKIVGPGNKYVAAAKRLVFGAVSIDMIAGPSEILVLADSSADPDWVAIDMLSQAEHDEDAVPRLVTWTPGYGEKVRAALERHLERIPRAAIARASLERHGLIVEAQGPHDAMQIANRFAPEHLEICCRDAEKLLGKVRHAGAVFVGRYTPEAAGDYAAGPNHVLPTGGTARFSSPLGPYDFVKRTSVVNLSEKALKAQGKTITTLADAEGLTAHGDSVRIRTGKL